MAKKNITGIQKCIIYSNDGSTTVDITQGINEFSYCENILTNTIEVELIYSDVLFTEKVSGKPGSLVETLPIVGDEKIVFKICDENKNFIKGVNNREVEMFVRQLVPMYDDTQKTMVKLLLVSKEFIVNKSISVCETIEGDISGWVEKCLTNEKYLNTQKKVNVEDTSQDTNGVPSWVCTNKTPFTAIDKLASRAVSDEYGPGYILFETSKGFNFKPISSLFDRDKNAPKATMIFTNSVTPGDLPPRYDTKVLSYDKSEQSDLASKRRMGAYGTRHIFFNPFTGFYEVKKITADQIKSKTAGKKLPTLNPEFGQIPFSRTMYHIVTNGSLPSGDTEEQIENSITDSDMEILDVKTQSSMRYNQIFSNNCVVTIDGNFKLNAGDSVFLDVPGSIVGKKEKLNKQDGGLYIISALTHFLSNEGTYTKMILSRDSVERKGKPDA